MLEDGIDYAELEAAARKRWPNRFEAPRAASAELFKSVSRESAPKRARTLARDAALLGPFDQASAGGPPDEAALAAEQEAVRREVIIRMAAPVFRIRGGIIDRETARAGQEGWVNRLDLFDAKLKPRYPAIGRIEATLSPFGPEGLGTAWLIARDVIVTNAHVARHFAEASDRGWRFRSQQGFDTRPMRAGLDTNEDANSLQTQHDIVEILYVSPTRDPDIAFLRIAGSGLAADPIPRFEGALPDNPDVAVIGYPERDDSIDKAELERYFGDVWGWKRFAPGFLGQVGSTAIRHLCNTLGGNSGSPLLELSTGHLLGLHYGGIPDRKNPVNHALPAQVVFKLLNELRIAKQPRREGNTIMSPIATDIGGGATATLTIPLTLTINLSLGGAAVGPSIAMALPDPAAASTAAPDLESAVAQLKDVFAARADVVHVRAGWKVTNGVITDTPAIVVAVERKEAAESLIAAGRIPFPTSFAGYPIDVAIASAQDIVDKFGTEEFLTEAARRISYRVRPTLMPQEVNRRMKITLRPGPDAGSGMLRDFLGQTEEHLTVGMYEFTAPHIIAATKDAMGGNKTMKMVLQKGESIGGSGAKKFDIKDEETVAQLAAALGDRFNNQWSARAIHPAYHIKVAARDDRALWLSSGSWQSSNQPKEDAEGAHSRYNREFHVIVHDAEVAKLFREHIEADAVDAAAAFSDEAAVFAEPIFWVPDDEVALVNEAARPPAFFPPLEIDRKVRMLPLLTPDNFSDKLLPLIRGARKSILLHNQSFSIAQTRADSFEALLAALKEKQNDPDIDVRIVLRGNEGPIDARANIEKMKTYGFRVSPDLIRIQPKLHNKMWIIDDVHSVIGSHNFTNQGTTINRDASLIFYDDPEIALYCRSVFDHDWERLAQRELAEFHSAVRRAIPGQPTPAGMRAVTASTMGL